MALSQSWLGGPTRCSWLPSPGPVVAKNTPGKMVKIHDVKNIFFTLWLLLYLFLLFITLSVLCSKLLKPTEWLSFETPSGSGTWLESKSANLLLFCARVTVGPPPTKLFRHITNLSWDMDLQIWIELLCQLLNKSIRLTYLSDPSPIIIHPCHWLTD